MFQTKSAQPRSVSAHKPAAKPALSESTFGAVHTLRRTPCPGLNDRPNTLPTGQSRDLSRIPAFGPARAPGFEPWLSSLISPSPATLQTKLVVGSASDPLEQEADRVADHVMNSGTGRVSATAGQPQLRRKCNCSGDHECATCKDEKKKVQTKPASAPKAAGTPAPPAVHRTLQSPGQPLDAASRSLMESRFGHDFGHVRVHTDNHAAQSAHAVNALAYTVGSDVVFAAGQYAPGTAHGQRLLAHELTHVLQQGDASNQPVLQRFAASEVNRIAPTTQDMLTQIKELIDAATTPNGDLNWDFLVEISGGASAGRAIDQAMGSKDPTIKSRLLRRYQFSCRCGLFDMRHFMQLLYISQFAAGSMQSEFHGNRAATQKGREHELTSESNSRFGAEDTPSNAMGAATNLSLPGLPKPDAVFNAIKDSLTRCSPIDWTSLSKPSQDQIIHFYGDLIPDPTPKNPGDQIPKNQNSTAVPDILSIAECGGRDRSFPYVLDDSDPDRKTISGKAFDNGSASLTSDSDIRDFIDTQRPEVIKALSSSEKVRLVKRLMQGWVSDDDLNALETIYNNSTSAEKDQIKAAASPDDLSGGQRTRLRAIYTK